jgi:hypothetical protein
MKLRNFFGLAFSFVSLSSLSWFIEMPDMDDLFDSHRRRIDMMNQEIANTRRKMRDTFVNGDSKFVGTKSINFSFDQNDEFATISCTLPEFIGYDDLDARWGKNHVIIAIAKEGFVLKLVIKEKQYSAEAYFAQNIRDNDTNVAAHSSLNQSISQVREFVNYVNLGEINIGLEKATNKLIVEIPFSEKMASSENRIPIKILDS